MRRLFFYRRKCTDGLVEDLGLGRSAAGPMRDRTSGAFGGVQEAAVLADGKAVGHAGNVVCDPARGSHAAGLQLAAAAPVFRQ